MKLKLKLIAGLLAGAIAFGAGGVSAFGEGEPAPAITEEEIQDIVDNAYLGTWATNSGYYSSSSVIRESDSVTITVSTVIPIVNCPDDLDTGDLKRRLVEKFSSSVLYAAAVTNDSFISRSSGNWTEIVDIVDKSLHIKSVFTDLVYIGEGNSLSYFINYSSQDSKCSIPFNVTVSECSPRIEEDEVTVTPSFILKPGSAYKIKAGTSTSINVQLGTVGSGKFSTVTASLSSADSNIKVEDIGEKSSSSASPSFSFRVSVPKTTPEGIYYLTLNTAVYDVNGSPASSGSYTIPVTVESNIKTSGLSLVSYDISKEPVCAGENFKLTLKLKNNCGIDLENVEVSLDGLDSSKFVLDGGFSKQSVNISNGKTGTVSFPLVGCAGINSTRESIPVTASYRIDSSKAETAQTFNTSVIVSCAPKSENQELGKYDLKITEYSASSDAVAEKTKFTLSLTVKNTSETDIKDARISLIGLDGSKFAIDSGLTYADFNIGAGKSKKFSFKLVGCAGITSIREVIPIQIDYGTVSSTVNATVSCVPPQKQETEEEQQVFAPNIIIESYDFGGDFVTAGQKFPLTVFVKNTSSTASIENLKITVNGASSNTDGSIAYSPANSSNSFFFEKMGTKETAEVKLDLLAKADAAPNSYPIILTFTYEYSVNGKRQQANDVTETITIPLQQEDRLTINQIEAPSYGVSIGMQCSISTSLVNKGKSGVYNVTAKVEGEGFDVSTGSYYIGNVASGTEEYYDAQITPYMEGEINGEVVITYEDANGAAKEQRMPFSFTAMNFSYDEGMIDDGGFVDPSFDPGMAEQSGDMTWLWFVIGGGAAVVIAVVIIIICVVRKKKRSRELEDDDEDI
ncbi:MAG: hypothetical protein ACI4J7_08980 [Ruminiclostridium sp.]